MYGDTFHRQEPSHLIAKIDRLTYIEMENMFEHFTVGVLLNNKSMMMKKNWPGKEIEFLLMVFR